MTPPVHPDQAIRWVLHRHEHPGPLGETHWHYDWMVGPWPGLPAERSLRSWRTTTTTTTAADVLRVEAFAAEDGPDHRAAYLDIQHRVLDGGRGVVQRVSGGRAVLIEHAADRVRVRLFDDDAPEMDGVELIGQRDKAQHGWWMFRKG